MPGEVIVHARFLEAQERHRTANRVTAAFAGSRATPRPSTACVSMSRPCR